MDGFVRIGVVLTLEQLYRNKGTNSNCIEVKEQTGE